MAQIVDLQDAPGFAALNIGLVSLATDSLASIERDVERLSITSPFLMDEDGRVAEAYGVDKWAMPSGEPGHTFVLVDERGLVRWVRDYGAPENGGLMYVEVDELQAELSALEVTRAGRP